MSRHSQEALTWFSLAIGSPSLSTAIFGTGTAFHGNTRSNRFGRRRLKLIEGETAEMFAGSSVRADASHEFGNTK
jgi:hypothetical protein